jgi:hypothetical protein
MVANVPDAPIGQSGDENTYVYSSRRRRLWRGHSTDVVVVVLVLTLFGFAANPEPSRTLDSTDASALTSSGAVLPMGQYLGHIAHWNDDPKSQKTAWLVVLEDGRIRRHWIPDIATYWCLKAHGAPGPDELSSEQLDTMPDHVGVWAECVVSQPRGGRCRNAVPGRGASRA